MHASYTRIFTNERGLSAFEDVSIALLPGFAVPPAEPLHTAPFLPSATGTFWVGGPPDWKGDDSHPAPRRMIFITVQGAYEVTAGTGETRPFPTGGVLLVEDTTGDGHSTRITSQNDCILFAVGLPD